MTQPASFQELRNNPFVFRGFVTTYCRNAEHCRLIWLKHISEIALPILPLPSSKGWIVRNHKWAIAAFKSGSSCSLPSNHWLKSPISCSMRQPQMQRSELWGNRLDPTQPCIRPWPSSRHAPTRNLSLDIRTLGKTCACQSNKAFLR